MKKRSEVDEKYKWDLSMLYASHEDYDRDFERVKELCREMLKFRGRLNSRDVILDEFRKSSELSMILEKMEVWLMLRKETDGTDKSALEDIAVLDNFLSDYGAETAFIDVELSKLDDGFLNDLMQDPEFSEFDRAILYLKDEKKHTLDETQEKMLTKIGSFANFSEIFSKLDDIEIKFGKIKLESGEEVTITNDNYNLFAHDKSQRVRKDAFEVLHKGFKDMNLTISENFISFLKYCDVMSEFRKFDDTVQSRLFSSRIKRDVLDGIVHHVNNNLESFYAYAKVLKKKLGLDVFHNIDVYAPVTSAEKHRLYGFDESVSIVKKALSPLGSNYLATVNKLVDSRTIDVYPTENKGGGGFSVGCYGKLPYILLNFNGTFNDVSTLAHEMGHSVHTYLSQTNQCFEKAGYDIFVAEIASTVNEILLFRYMEKTAESDDERKSYIANFLSTFYATVFRQTMFTEFELFVHGATKNRVPITYETLNFEYGKLQKKYFGEDVILLENANVEWSRIPHFYRPFYVYKYATGFVAACSIVSNILERGEDYVKNYYLKFLSAGSTKDPVDILKLADVDITDNKTYKSAFKLFDDYVNIFDSME